jgi:hypothetical protein
MTSFPWICPLCLKQKYVVVPSAVYCNLDHFTFSHLNEIYEINVQQYTAFETLALAILFTQKNKNQKFTQGTTTFPNLHKSVFLLSVLDVGTKCPHVTDTYSIKQS